ncbi:MAG: carbohydrate ABC transporter permease [Anaerolineae bacterium]
MLRLTANARRDFRNGLLFTSPWLIGLIVFTIYPIFASIYFSFTDYSVLKAPRWVGLENYITLFTEDRLFPKSMTNTLYYAALALPLGIIGSVALALLLNKRLLGMSVYRTVFYLPNILPTVAMSVLWIWLLNPNYGLFNSILQSLGLPGVPWLTSPTWSKPSFVIMSLWGIGGSMVIYLAGLQDIPEHLYEAADLDGATGWQKIRHVTLPMLTPTIFFNLVMGLIGVFSFFTQAFVMTHGGPLDSTLFYMLYLYQNAFVYFKMGYASAMAWILFVIVVSLTLLVFKSSGRWVYYGGSIS